ncbi:hypothetical protein PC117_g20831 [Phytophthora cactorum]|nr:hypothetical protein PC117_g20831 [Phytophthora cactorum]
MAIRKKPSKHTTPAMETHRSKGMAHLVETSERMERAEAKDTTAAEPASETKDTTEAKDTTKAKDMPVAQTNPRKHRRELLQDDGEASASEAIEEEVVAPISLPCVVDDDAKLMRVSAQYYTVLNSDEDTSADEEQEDDDEDASGEAD